MLLGFTPAALAFVLFKIPYEQKYRHFTIAKRGGGEREINAPMPQLKLLQARLAELLYECIKELEMVQPNRTRVTHGFQLGRSIITNAEQHRQRRYVLNLDLEDFFGSINFGRVRGFFHKDVSFELAEPVATTIAQIACWQNKLPQGSPCSPVISNLIGHIMDIRLLRLAKATKCRYTRYADDISFSTNACDFPSALAVRNADALHIWTLSDTLESAIQRAGFAVNHTKTRMQIKGSRQEATGLIVNEKVNVKAEYARQTRAMCHHLFSKGVYVLPAPVGETEKPDPTSNLAPLEGRLSHIHLVKNRTDLSVNEKKVREFKPPKSPAKLYGRFLFYKHFVAANCPVLVTEGPSDIIYLRIGLRARGEFFPRLCPNKNNSKFGFRFLNPSETLKELLDLGNGTSGIGKLIGSYKARLKKFEHKPLLSPVILIVDNDKGAKSVFDPANKMLNDIDPEASKISLDSEDSWHYLGENLYLIKIPHGGAKASRVIEDLLPSEWLETELNGKKFDPKKPHGDHNAFSKIAFAKGVIRANAAQIDFTKFDQLFTLIDSAIQHYAGIRAASQQALLKKSA